MTKPPRWRRAVLTILGLSVVLAIMGCPPALPVIEPAPDLEGYWVTIEIDPGTIDAEEEIPARVDTDFMQFTKLTSDDGSQTYVVSRACNPTEMVAYVTVLDDGAVQIQDFASGATLQATLDVDDEGNETLRAVEFEEDSASTWFATHIEAPPCTDEDGDGIQEVPLYPVEQEDSLSEMVGFACCEEEEPLQGRVIVDSAKDTRKAQSASPNGMAHLLAAVGSRMRLGDELAPKPLGAKTEACSNAGASVSCSTAGGHPGYIQCAAQEMTQSKIQELSNVVSLIDTDQVYPGALLQGAYFDGGSYVPVTIPRASGKITMANLYGTNARFSRDLGQVSYSNVTDGIMAILGENKIEGTAADASYSVETAYSSSEWAFKMGVDVKAMGADIKSSIDTGASSQSNTIVLKFTQVFYTVSYQDPAHRYDVFADGANFDDPENQIGTGNPPVYVSNVKYGRQLFFVARSSLGSHYVTAALKGAYNGVAATVTVDSGMTYKDVLKNSSITYIVRGGDAGLALDPLKSATPDQMYDAIKNLLANRNAATWSPQNPGVPVAYTLRYLDDRSVALKGLSTTYNQHDCHTVPATDYQFHLSCWNIDKDITVWVDGVQKFYQKGGKFDVPVNPWLSGDGKDHTVRIVLGNGNCFCSHAGFAFYKDGAITWGPYDYNPWGWQLCSDQVDLRFTVNASNGTAQQSYFWHRH